MATPASRLGLVLALTGLLLAVGCQSSASDAGGLGGAGGRAPVVLPRGLALAPYVDIDKIAGGCAELAEIPYQPASTSVVVSLLTGRWQYCRGMFADDTPDGIELDPDRRRLTLQQVQGRGLEVATGPNTEAIWFMGAEQPLNGLAPVLDHDPTTLHLIFLKPKTIDTATFGVEFFDRPTGLRLAGSVDFVWLGE